MKMSAAPTKTAGLSGSPLDQRPDHGDGRQAQEVHRNDECRGGARLSAVVRHRWAKSPAAPISPSQGQRLRRRPGDVTVPARRDETHTEFA